MPSDPLNLEPKNGDFVDYIESLQASSQKNLDGITPPMTADHHIGLPPNAAGRADDGISLKDLIAAFRRKTGMPKSSPQDSSREAAWRAWSRRPTPMLLNPSLQNPKNSIRLPNSPYPSAGCSDLWERPSASMKISLPY